MRFFAKYFYYAFVFVALIMVDAFGANLSGVISVNKTAETASDAKNDAMNEAIRTIINNILSKYANTEDFSELMQKTSDEELMNIISSSGVANEQMSTTDYSAQITINIDNDAAKKWLDDNEVQNWVPLRESDEKFTALIVVQNGLVDWAELKRIVRADNFEVETQSINGNQVVVKMPLNYRSKFTVSVREAGWRYSDNDGVLQIWK